MTRKQIREFIAKHEKLVQDGFLLSVKNAHGQLDFEALKAAVERGDYLAASQMMTLSQSILWPVESAAIATFYEAGATVSMPRGVNGAFSFDGRHFRAEQIIAEIGANLVSEIGSPPTEVIREIIAKAPQQGVGKTSRQLAGIINPRTGIREGGIMGLDAPRAHRSVRVREILSDPDQIADYFNGNTPRYTSTDRRFDTKVRKAIKEGRALPNAEVERIAKLHDARLLKARAQTIAANETFTAQAQGRNEAYKQMLDRDDVEAVTKKWQHATAKNPRHDHIRLNGKTIPYDESFIMADGTRMQYPHDPAGGARNSIACRCTLVYLPKFKKD